MTSPLTRRTVLRGAGVALALPLLDAMGAAPPRSPRRLLFMYAPNGKVMDHWTPDTGGALSELPPTLELLKPFFKKMDILSGLCLRNAAPGGDGPGDHARAMAAFLTGVRPHKTAGRDLRAGVSVDQLAASVLGRGTRLPSLEVGCEGGSAGGPCDNGYSCAYQTNLSWRTPSLPMPKETDPRVIFERLFGVGSDDRRTRERVSLLDFVAEDARHFRSHLGGNDRHKLDEYLDSVREVERRISSARPVAAGMAKPTGTPEDYAAHARLLGDLVALAFRADLTRIVTFVLGNDGSNRAYREVGVSEGHHDLSHHGGDAARLTKLRRINRLHVAQLTHLLGRLEQLKEGDGSVLDHCQTVYGSGIRDGDRHDHDDLPILLAGGGIRRGTHIRHRSGTPLCNLHLSLLEWAGVRAERFGDSDGRLTGVVTEA
jgi:Protein of unknown function (DUF1552)